MKLTEELRKEYQQLFDTMKIEDSDFFDSQIKRIFNFKDEYQAVEFETGVPWFVVSCIHALEAGLDFTKKIKNGQYWNKRTTWVPKGLGPWNSWHESSVEAMKMLNDKMKKILGESFTWDVPAICYAFEYHNGWGYRKYHSHVKSPYLWSMSNHYVKGKYVADGKWDDNAVSKQIGAMVYIKEIMERRGPVAVPPVEPQPIPKPEPVKPKPVPQPKRKSFLETWFGWLCLNRG